VTRQACSGQIVLLPEGVGALAFPARLHRILYGPMLFSGFVNVRMCSDCGGFAGRCLLASSCARANPLHKRHRVASRRNRHVGYEPDCTGRLLPRYVAKRLPRRKRSATDQLAAAGGRRAIARCGAVPRTRCVASGTQSGIGGVSSASSTTLEDLRCK